MREWRRPISAGWWLACALLVPFLELAGAAEPTDKFDNFRMREGFLTQLKQVAPDLYFLHLLNGISGNKMDQQKNHRNHKPDNRDHVKQAG